MEVAGVEERRKSFGFPIDMVWLIISVPPAMTRSSKPEATCAAAMLTDVMPNRRTGRASPTP